MHSFSAIAAALFALAALAPVSASIDSDMSLAARGLELNADLVGQHQLVKRRPNHADEYGYPHGLPKKHDGTKMTPGGYYKSVKKSNFGSKCKSDKHCHSKVRLSLGVCDHGSCSFRCLGDTIKQGGSCVGKFTAPKCKTAKHCPRTHIEHAKSACNNGKCIFSCNKGYHPEGNKCVKSTDKCGKKECAPVKGGFNTCVRNKCSPQCNTYLGFKLYSDGHGYRCINTQNDPANCGRIGHHCKPGYNGKGSPICQHGKCSLSCPGMHLRKNRHGQYCSTL